MGEEVTQPDVSQEQPDMTTAEIRYLVYMMFVEMHRQRELLATIAMSVAKDPSKVQQLIDAQQQQEYQIPFDFLEE